MKHKPNKMEIIINADDFGKDEQTTDAIMTSFRKGWITHSTCMVNMSYCAEAMKIASYCGVVDKIGLHVNLSEGEPLTDTIKECELFCSADGRFNGACYRRSIGTRFWLPRTVREAVAEEVQSQCCRFIELGGRLMHADSHHHVHFDWSIGSIVVPILKKMGFKTARISYNAGNGRRLPVKIYREIYNKWVASHIGVRSDWFCSYPGYQDETSKWNERNGTVEIMVHPIFVDGVVKDGEDGVPMGAVCACNY